MKVSGFQGCGNLEQLVHNPETLEPWNPETLKPLINEKGIAR